MSEAPEPTFATTPLHHAADAGDLALCRKLVGEGAGIDALDESGWPPLIRAVQGNYLELTRYLLQQGASIRYTYRHEDTPKARAHEHEKYAAIWEQLGLPESKLF